MFIYFNAFDCPGADGMYKSGIALSQLKWTFIYGCVLLYAMVISMWFIIIILFCLISAGLEISDYFFFSLAFFPYELDVSLLFGYLFCKEKEE